MDRSHLQEDWFVSLPASPRISAHISILGGLLNNHETFYLKDGVLLLPVNRYYQISRASILSIFLIFLGGARSFSINLEPGMLRLLNILLFRAG